MDDIYEPIAGTSDDSIGMTANFNVTKDSLTAGELCDLHIMIALMDISERLQKDAAFMANFPGKTAEEIAVILFGEASDVFLEDIENRGVEAIAAEIT